MSTPKFEHNSVMCDICGKPRGRFFNHAKCSKLRQEQHKDDKHWRKKAALGDRALDHFSKLK